MSMGYVRTLAMAFAAFVLTFTTASPARAEWLKAETEHFVVVGDTGRGTITEYARKVERFHSMLAMFLPPENDDIVAPKLWIFMTNGHAQMNEIWPDISRNVGGFYSRSDDRIYAVVDTDSGMGDETLFHEYAHHYMYQYHNAAYPGWFVEGFAEYFAPSEMKIGRIRYGLFNQGRVYSLNQRQDWVPMADLLNSHLNINSRREGAAYYAQAWLLTNYMLGDPTRRGQLSAYLAGVGRGEDATEALEKYIGKTPDELGRELRLYLGRGITVYTLQQTLPTAEVTVTSLPRSTGDVIWMDLRLAKTVGDDGPALLARAQAAVNRYPGDRLPAVVLAKAQRATKDLAGARQTLDGVLAAAPDDAEARWLMAEVLIEQADETDDDATRLQLSRLVQSHLAAGYQADPLDFRIYLAMLHNRQGTPGFPSDNDVTIAESAWRLAPQLGSTAFEAGQVLMTRERYADAAYVLAPLANSPHGGESLAPVRSLLAQARENAGLPPLSTDAPPDADSAEGGEGPAAPDAPGGD